MDDIKISIPSTLMDGVLMTLTLTPDQADNVLRQLLDKLYDNPVRVVNSEYYQNLLRATGE